jgi:hypothetical protein
MESTENPKVPFETIVSKNDSLIIRIGTDYWTCSLSSNECQFLQALLQNDCKMHGNNTQKWIAPPRDVSVSNDLPIRNFLKAINRKLRSKKMPVRLSFVGWNISIEMK